MDNRFVYLNGSFLKKEEAKISLFSRGLLFGDGLFETMRAYGGRVFRFAHHFERLVRSSETLRIPFPISRDELYAALIQLLELNRLQEAYIRLMVWRGEGLGVEPGAVMTGTIALLAENFIPYPQELYERGMKGTLVSLRRDETSPLSRIKSLNFLPNILAKMEAKEKGADEGILLNTKGEVAEGTVSNLFLVRGGRLLTPSLESGALPGITRAAILELARREGLLVFEGEIQLQELREAEEAFLTNTLMEVMPLTSLDGTPLGPGRPGPITRFLARAYRELVAGETGSAWAASTSAR